MGKSKHKNKDGDDNFEFDLDLVGQSYHSYEATMALGGNDYIDAGFDDRSTKTGKKKKKKSKSTSALSVGSGFDDDRKKRSKRRIRKKGSDDDNASVGSYKSTKSTKSTKSRKSVRKIKKKDDDDDNMSVRSKRSVRSVRKSKSKSDLKREVNPEPSLNDNKKVKELEIENAALLDETAAVRKQLIEAEQALKKALADQGPQQANIDLRRELEEYEDAVIEKDELIQKLTEAVETQVDKVEELQVKLVGAEDEICKMEEEMKDMEFVIEDLRGRPPSHVDLTNSNDGRSSDVADKTLDEEILEQLDERKRELERREQDLLIKEDIMMARQNLVKEQEDELAVQKHEMRKANEEQMARETLIKEQEAELATKRDELAMKRSAMLEANDTATNNIANNTYELEANIAELKARNNDLEDQIRQVGTRAEVDNAKEAQHEEELRSLRTEYEKKIADSKLETEILRKEFDGFKERKNSENEELRRQVKSVKMEKQHVEASSRQMQRMVSVRMESMRSMDPESTKNMIVEEDEDFSLQVEVEIAELREKIVDQENHSLKLKKQIDVHVNEIEELKQALEDRDIEMKNVGSQIQANQETAAKKMKQKDETITFMQRTMMQINQEKQEMQKILRESKLDVKQIELNRRAESDEAEKAKFEAINAELRKLDEENRQLEETLTQVKYDNSLKMKERESAFLEVQEELNNVKWELGAREKGADYITLLKDRKERKIQLANAKRDLKEAEEKISDLERQMADFESTKKELENEIETLNDTDGNAKQIQGLKRQIKSLKEHNATLERKLENQTRETEDTLVEKVAKIQILEYELHKLRNAPPETGRGVMSGFNFGFGRRNDEGQSNSNGNSNTGSTVMEGFGSANSTPSQNGSRWGLWGQRKETPKTPSNHQNMPSRNGFAEIASL